MCRENQKIEIWIDRVVLQDEVFVDKDAVKEKIIHRICNIDTQQQIHLGHSRSLGRRAYWRIAISVAAVICLAVGLGSRVNVTNTGTGTELQYALPDGSSVVLAQDASIHFNRIGWLFAHRLTLAGDASFAVTKQNGTFSVMADKGTITVLGTRFTIEQRMDNLHVVCTEGSVEVSTDIGAEIMHKDQRLDYNGSQMQVLPIYPEYLEFDSTPLSEVLSKIEQVYGLTVENATQYSDQLFSGWVSTQNKEQALEVVLGSCGISFELNGDTLTVKH